MKRFLVGATTTSLLLLLIAQPAYAFGLPDLKRIVGSVLGESTDSGRLSPEERLEKLRLERDRKASRAGELKLRGKERACEVRRAAFKRRHNKRPQMARAMLIHLGKVIERVQEFYENKVVPAGGTAENYDSLLADTQAKKAAVEAAVQAFKDADPDFDCAKPETFDSGVGRNKQLLEDVKEAIKDYRDAVKKLVKAVKEAATEARGGDDNGTGSGSL